MSNLLSPEIICATIEAKNFENYMRKQGGIYMAITGNLAPANSKPKTDEEIAQIKSDIEKEIKAKWDYVEKLRGGD